MERIATKKELALRLGIPRRTLYYTSKKAKNDWKLKGTIEEVLHEHPSYGHRRIALHLSLNKKRIRRVMRLYGIKPYRRRTKKQWKKPKEEKNIYTNLLLRIVPTRPHMIWVSDFTHIRWRGRWVYLATVMDIFTRRIVGWHVLAKHTTDLVLGALIHALNGHEPPTVVHSDQGSEYTSDEHIACLREHHIFPSMSHKGCPWENGYQESFYDKFKVDLGDPNRFDHLGQLISMIYQTLYYYNTIRIHTALKMPPAVYAERLYERSISL